MDVKIDLVFHYLGRRILSPKLAYIGGESEVIEDFDVDCLSYTHIRKKYIKELGCSNLCKVYVLKPGRNLDDGLYLIEDDQGIIMLSSYITRSTIKPHIHVYANDDDGIDLPHSRMFELVVENETQLSQARTQCSTFQPKNPLGSGCTPISQFNFTGWVRGLSADNPNLAELSQFQGSSSRNDQFQIGVDRILGNVSGQEVVNVDILEESESRHLDRLLFPENEDLRVNSTDEEDGDEEDEDEEGEDDGDGDEEDEDRGGDEVQFENSAMWDHGDEARPHFMLGKTFRDADEARVVITRYSIVGGYDLKLRPNEPGRIRAKCKGDGCEFEMFISKEGKYGGLIVKKLQPEHTCYRNFNNSLATAKFLAKQFKEKLYENPNTKVKELVAEAEAGMKVTVSHAKCKRAKKMILNELEGSYVVEFGYLAAYAAAIKRTNPGSAAEIDLCEEGLRQGKRIFRRMFICFDALKRGWKAGCRPLIGLDGCFLKGIVKGQVLVAVGKDAQEQMYPIAWAVTDRENKANWRWFLQWLKKELDLETGSRITLISDMQKGLLQAVKDILPNAEHRWCARHIEANWAKKWHSDELKKRFWICAWSTYREEFNDNLKVLGDVCKQAAEDLLKYPPQTWSRAFISSRCKSKTVDNNISESFNSSILAARHKPIVSMLENIRKDAMMRIATRKAQVDKWKFEWSPACMDAYHDNKVEAFGSTVLFNGVEGYEIIDGDDAHTVFIKKQSCTCRLWDITGIPCSHAIRALDHAKTDPMSQISQWYHKTSYIASYQYAMEPMLGKKFMNCEAYKPIEPPPVIKLPGRPKKKRVRSEFEGRGQRAGKISRKGTIISCSRCHGEGHNVGTCSAPIPEPLPDSTPPKSSNAGNVKQCKGKSGKDKPTPEPPSNSTISTTTDTQLNSKSGKYKGKSQVNKKRTKPNGIGIYIDEDTGHMIENPGMASERLISQFDGRTYFPPSSNPDPELRFPIPSEREIRQTKRDSKLPSSSGSRKIGHVGDGYEVLAPSDLPFKAAGLKWQGQPCMTTSQLQEQRHKTIGRIEQHGNTTK